MMLISSDLMRVIQGDFDVLSLTEITAMYAVKIQTPAQTQCIFLRFELRKPSLLPSQYACLSITAQQKHSMGNIMTLTSNFSYLLV